MNLYRFWWDENNIEHIANHGVEPYEAEEVIDDDPFIVKGGGGKYLAYGQTDAGRYLLRGICAEARATPSDNYSTGYDYRREEAF